MNQQTSNARDLPVFAERTQGRVMGATDWWFYPLIAVAALGLIGLSLGADIIARDAQPQRAAHAGAALTYGPHELARGLRFDSAHVSYVVRDLGVSARAVRFAVRPGTPPPTDADTGVQLLLDPADTGALAGRSVRVELQVRRFSVTAASAIAVRLDRGPWITAPLPPADGPVVLTVPAPSAPPQTLGLRMLSTETDLNYGAEFTRIVLRPAP